MINLDNVQDKVMEEIGDTKSWCQEQYDNLFSKYFEGLPELYDQLSSKQTSRLSDSELEGILTYLPLQLISVSEELSQYKLNYESLKLYIKKLERDKTVESTAKTISEKREEAASAVLEYRVLASAYSSIINRVENQINFSRELIMTVKKIWDSRNRVYNASPICSDSLDDYVPDK